MVLIKKIVMLLILFISVLSFSYAVEEREDILNYIQFRIEDNSNTNKVSYEINYDSDFSLDNFKVEIYYNNVLKDICQKNLENEINSIFSEIIMCEVKKYGPGEYKFVAQVSNNNQVIVSKNSSFNIERNIYTFENNLNSTMEFVDLGDKTLVLIELKEKGENLQILNSIPKEVIPFLSQENKNDLISTNFEYTIIESDPLIAWSVDKAPAKINYTIHKKVSIEDQKNFSLEIEQDSTFNKFKWIIYVLIIVIIGLALKPAFKK